MGYLNYTNNVNQKPQGFGQQKVQLTKDGFIFGDIGSVNSNQQPPQIKKDVLMQLFPTPLLICPCPFDYSGELEWIKKQPFKRQNRDTQTEKSFNNQTEDTFILDKPEMSRVRKFIDSKIKQFLFDIMGSDNELVITQSWVNKNGKGQQHHEHSHPNSMISGVWYPQINEELPPIHFRNQKQRDISLSIKEFNAVNSATFMLPLRRGELIIFSSDILHSVPINMKDEERISLSFNTWAKGSMGSIDTLTYIPIDRCV